eukprot:TRINITY_DN18435_c0_g1_i1.p1 TRINITY_DN18435_c0_g1~~TRINITY_DN18435_c0_g1_i1.p1  ORF type:complete len:526 (+),score=146.08 TRINITY_DN18435_c0_g1_i1:195-1772(+)
MAGISAIAERLKNSALFLESQHQAFKSSMRELSPETTTTTMKQNSIPRTIYRPPSSSPRRRTATPSKGFSLANNSPKQVHIVETPSIRDFDKNASHNQQVSSVYADLSSDNKNQLSLSLLNFFLQKYDIDLEPSVFEGMFKKADIDKDGILSFNEFDNLCRVYPTFISCLYTRGKRRKKEEDASANISQERAKYRKLQDDDKRQESLLAQGRHDIEMKRETVRKKQQKVSEVEAKQRSAKGALETSSESRELLEAEQQKAEASLSTCKHKAQQCSREHESAERHREQSVKILKTQEAKHVQQVERLRELESQLKEQQAEVERQNARTTRAFHDLKAADKNCQVTKENLEVAESESQASLKNIQKIEQLLHSETEKEKKAETVFRELSQLLNQCINERDSLSRQVESLEDKADQIERSRLTGKTESQLLVTEQEGVVKRLEQALEESRLKRKRTEEKETPVLLMEIRLRRKRESLEEEEQELLSCRKILSDSEYDNDGDPLADLFSPRQNTIASTELSFSASPSVG